MSPIHENEMHDSKPPIVVALTTSSDDVPANETASGVMVEIHIDPAIETSALRKFDKWLLPVAFTFLVLSSLDRTNVSERLLDQV